MCGFVGLIRRSDRVDQSTLIKMIQAIRHRGPDAQQVWHEENVGLGHARLSIHDLSEAGAQPMFSHSGRWIIAFNGEIYNYKVLAKSLQQEIAIEFRSDCDTEVLVNAIEYWGLDKTLKQCTGMFAFALWDRKEKKCYIARDRFGEKPLYYGCVNNYFVCSSELKPIQTQFKPDLSINREILASYMRYGYVPTPHCIYTELFKLSPGVYAEVQADFSIKETRYWSAVDVALAGYRSPLEISFESAVSELESKLKDTLRYQMAADVPLGAFLSGGVDSSTVVALMQSLSSKQIKTFSIGFHEKAFNEAPYAKAVAEHLGTDHTELYVSAKQAMDVIPDIPTIYDEPFADSSQIPTFLVSKLAKQYVSVVLTGDAADELFGGYGRYFLAQKLQQLFFDKKLLGHCIKLIPPVIFSIVDNLSLGRLSSDKLRKMQHLIGKSDSFNSLYDNLCNQPYENTNQVVINIEKSNNIYQDNLNNLLGKLDNYSWMLLMDSINYLQNDILTKVDRAAMSNSLETRVPFLDHEIYKYAWQLPIKYKISHGNGKKIIKALLGRYVPKTLVNRPKVGFGIPYGAWLKSDLKSWADDLLSKTTLEKQNYLNSKQVAKIWKEHLSGKRNWQGILWNILMFQAWLEEYK